MQLQLGHPPTRHQINLFSQPSDFNLNSLIFHFWKKRKVEPLVLQSLLNKTCVGNTNKFQQHATNRLEREGQGDNVLFLQLENDIFCQLDKVIFLDGLSSTRNSMMEIDIFPVSLHSTKSVEVGHGSTSPLDMLYFVLQ